MLGCDKFILEDANKISKIGLENYFGHYPSGSSFKNLAHLRQNLQTGKFAKYDYGLEVNQMKYSQILAPEYDLSKIRDVPIALFCGRKDVLASPEDYEWTKE
jgi:lysosomal acid lipase/cholesteryl ester hydrolase